MISCLKYPPVTDEIEPDDQIKTSKWPIISWLTHFMPMKRIPSHIWWVKDWQIDQHRFWWETIAILYSKKFYEIHFDILRGVFSIKNLFKFIEEIFEAMFYQDSRHNIHKGDIYLLILSLIVLPTLILGSALLRNMWVLFR